MRVSELKQGSQMDALVALAQEWDRRTVKFEGFPDKDWWGIQNQTQYMPSVEEYDPSDGNAQTYELIEKFGMGIGGAPKLLKGWWAFTRGTGTVTGSTPAEAICKAVIASKWGDTIPNEIWEKVR